MKKSNWPMIVLIVVTLGIISTFGYFLWNQPEAVSVGIKSNATAPNPILAANWSISNSAKDVAPTLPIAYSESVYAVKEGRLVTVWKRNMITGTTLELFRYNEVHDAVSSGNTWDGLPPNAALSHGRTKLAYVSTDGLYVCDLTNDITRDIIRQITPITNNEQADPKPPTWTVPEMTSTYTIALPSWSYDDSYLGFVESLSEGSWSSAINTEARTYVSFTSDQSDNPQRRLMVSIQPIIWSPVSLAGIIPGNDFGYSTPGLFVTAPNRFGNFINLSKNIAGSSTKSFIEAAYSPNGHTIAYTTQEDYEGTLTLSLVGIDGSNNTIISQNENVSNLFFSSDGSKLYFIRRVGDVNQLAVFSLENNTTETVAILPELFNKWTSLSWTSEGYLSLVGLVRDELARAGKMNQLFLLDLSSKTVIYASPISEKYTSYLGYI